jgi:hypothetical protein
MAENPPPSVVDGLIQCLYRSFGATTFHTSLAPWAINPNSSSGARSLPSSMSGGDVNRLVAYIRQVPEHNLVGFINIIALMMIVDALLT